MMLDNFNKLNEDFKRQITEIQEANSSKNVAMSWLQLNETQKKTEKLLISKPKFQLLLLNMKYCAENYLLKDFHSYLLKLHKEIINSVIKKEFRDREIWNIGNAVGHVCEMQFTKTKIHFTLSDWNLDRLKMLIYELRTKFNAKITENRSFEIKEDINYKYRKLKARQIYEIKGIIAKKRYKEFKKTILKYQDWDLLPKHLKFLNDIPFIKNLFFMRTIKA